MTLGELPETRLVEALLRLLPDADALVGPGDDGAVVRVGEQRLVLSVDSQRQGVHFRPDWIDAGELGARALHVALSDLAAMAADPLCSLLALAGPAGLACEWLERFVRGFAAAAGESGCPVVGGDVARAQAFAAEVTVVGVLPTGREPLRRAGARPGDDVWVSGSPGLAAAGRELLQATQRARAADSPDGRRAIEAWRRPRARVALARELVRAGVARAAIDVSDGVAIDLLRLCRASGTGVLLEAEVLVDATLSALAGGFEAALAWALGGGEDYELLFAARPAMRETVAACGGVTGVDLRRVGRLLEPDEGEHLLVGGERHRLAARGFQHFGAG